MKKQIVSLAVAVGLLTGGTTFAATNYFKQHEAQLKVQYTKVIQEKETEQTKELASFKKEEEQRIKRETDAYLNEQLEKMKKAQKTLIRKEANVVINNLKKHIDSELGAD
jgi:hypothetical protein